MSKENNTQTRQGSELFDNYLSIKKALTTKIKSVLDIMAQCNSLDVTPDDAIKWVTNCKQKFSQNPPKFN